MAKIKFISRRRRQWNSLAEWGVIRALLCVTLWDFCNALSFFESHRNPALICLAMSPNHNNGGLHGCTGNVLPPTSYCGQAVGGGSARSIGKGRIRRGCEPLARAGGADRMAAIRSARKPSRRRRDERNDHRRAAAPQRLKPAEKATGAAMAGEGTTTIRISKGIAAWSPMTAASSRGSNV